MKAPRLYVLCFLSLLFVQQSMAQQSCSGETFSKNILYATCNTLPYLSASLHWTYHASNGTVDVAYRSTQSSDSWVAWAINPRSQGMLGAEAFMAYHDSNQVVTVITTKLSNYTPIIEAENLTFTVYSKEAEYSNGAYTIYATLQLPNNNTNQNTVWQASTSFQNGLPASHPTTGDNVQSQTSLNFFTGDSVVIGGETSRQRRKNLHGVLNAISWGILMPIGIIIARYLKVFQSADPAWFYLHVACQLSAYILGVAGWGLGLKLGSESVGITYHKHRDIGIAMFALATLQVFALLLRPQKDHKYRLYWNLYHWSVGYSVIILGIINIFKGFDILLPAETWKHAYIGVIAALALIALVLEVFTWAIVLKRKDSSVEDKSHNGANGANGNGYDAWRHQVV